MFQFTMSIVCSSSILDIVMLYDEFMHKITKRLAQYLSELSGRHYVSMVLRYYLPADAFCTLGHVVDMHMSFVVHSPFVEHVERDCEGR